MEGGKPAHRSRGSSELFVCFTSKASSSMRIFRDGSSTLHPSLSRRLKSSRSMKGGQASPMFPAGTRRKGCSFDTPEPSSPKVTCIGQVRVKAKMATSRSRTRQECFPGRNQRRVLLPLNICDALRSFGADFSCFLPCGGREKETKPAVPAAPHPAPESSCAAAFARWLMALQESEEEEIRDAVVEGVDGVAGEEEAEQNGEIEEGEVNICVPPKNALLLMRFRSEPFRMSSFAPRFSESPVLMEREQDDGADDEDDDHWGVEVRAEEQREEEACSIESEAHAAAAADSSLDREYPAEIHPSEIQGNQQKAAAEAQEEVEGNAEMAERDINAAEDCEEEEHMDQASCNQELEEEEHLQENGGGGETEEETQSEDNEAQGEVVEEDAKSNSACICQEIEPAEAKWGDPKTEKMEDEGEEKTMVEMVSVDYEIRQAAGAEEDAEENSAATATMGSVAAEMAEIEIEGGSAVRKVTKDGGTAQLPDSLLLMMCEPKLSMEVSKETWVCSVDFHRCRPSKPPAPAQYQLSQEQLPRQPCRVEEDDAGAADRGGRRRPSVEGSVPPPRLSLSLATVVEQKLVSAAAYAPFVLPRCKSEPVRASAKLSREQCFWRSRKVPHVALGAAGVGF